VGGIGAAIAYRFAQEGARLVINSNRRNEKAFCSQLSAVRRQSCAEQGCVKVTEVSVLSSAKRVSKGVNGSTLHPSIRPAGLLRVLIPTLT